MPPHLVASRAFARIACEFNVHVAIKKGKSMEKTRQHLGFVKFSSHFNDSMLQTNRSIV